MKRLNNLTNLKQKIPTHFTGRYFFRHIITDMILVFFQIIEHFLYFLEFVLFVLFFPFATIFVELFIRVGNSDNLLT